MAKQPAQKPALTPRALVDEDRSTGSMDQATAHVRPERVKESRARQRTRLRLITAAEAVMAKHGVEKATIHQITEEAELAAGTFYNHFRTKEEVAIAVFAHRAEELGKAFDLIGEVVQDPACAIAFIQRTYIERALADPVWGWFVIHAEFSLRQNEETFRDRARSDILLGIQANRFNCESCLESATSITLSSMVGVTREILEGRASKDAACETIELLLRMYGISADEAAALARLPVPDFNTLAQSKS